MPSIKNQITVVGIRILRPLIRILLQHNISLSEFVEMAKSAYVDVAYSDFSIEGKPKTVSHAAVVTGLSRKEVLRVQKLKITGIALDSGHINRASRVIAGWLHDKDFCDSKGNPNPLTVKGKLGSFEALVKRYSGDITWGAVLDELLRLKSISISDDHIVTLIEKAYIPNKNDEQKATIFGECATDFFETFAHNFENNQSSPRLQRSVAYNNIPEQDIAEFEKLAKKKSEKLLIELNQWLAEKNCPPTSQDNNISYKRIGLGIYYFNNDAGGVKKYEKE